MSKEKPTKKEIILALIDAGYSFEQVAEKKIAKESYVKTVFTQAGLTYLGDKNPEEGETLTKEPEAEEPEAEEPEAEEPEAEEPEAEEPEAEEPEAEDNEDPLAPLYAEALECLEDVDLVRMPYMTKARCAKYCHLAKQVLILKDLKGEKLQSLNARYAYIVPRPAGSSSSMKVAALHKAMNRLFRAKYKL